MSLTPELCAKLEASKNLPSPPGVASKIIALANDPEAELQKISKVLALDPAITTKILRLANSPMYAQRRKPENLRQAVVVLGMNATISLALSFSLIKSWPNKQGGDGLDYLLFWRRALLAATIARVLAEKTGLRDSEEVFLTALTQDIGMLVLTGTIPGIYEGLGAEQVKHDLVIKREIEVVDTDHAAVGGWLLKRWHFPDRIQQGVAASHNPERVASIHEHALFVRCVALSSKIAESFLDSSGARNFQTLATEAQRQLKMGKDALGDVIQTVKGMLPDIESIFETQILTDTSNDQILEEAREALMLRSLQTLQVVDSLQHQAHSLESRTRDLEESSRRDGLTGLYNRRYLDDVLVKAFRDAETSKHPLSVAFADLDKFKLVNDTYGHQVGDQVLLTTARILECSVRSSDIVARYGGEEFIILFPNTDHALVKTICERIVGALQKTSHEIEPAGKSLTVTISIGTATHGGKFNFATQAEFVSAADKALYTAKLTGRNRAVPFDMVA